MRLKRGPNSVLNTTTFFFFKGKWKNTATSGFSYFSYSNADFQVQVKWMKKKRQWRQRCCQEHDQESSKNKERENSVVCRFQSVMCRAITQRDRKGRGGGRSSTKKKREWKSCVERCGTSAKTATEKKKRKTGGFRRERGKKKKKTPRFAFSHQFRNAIFLLLFFFPLFFSFLSFFAFYRPIFGFITSDKNNTPRKKKKKQTRKSEHERRKKKKEKE